MTILDLWDTAKQFWGKFIAIQSYLKKQGKHWLDNLTLYLKQLIKKNKEKIVEGKKS